MGRYKDFREPRRRGHDDDVGREFGSDRPYSPPPSYHQQAAPQGIVTDATVKWFNADKGFGFVQATDGSEAFLHIRALEQAGFASAPEGSKLKVRIGAGQKGPQVTEVLELDTSTAAPARPPRSQSYGDRAGGGGGGGYSAGGPSERREGAVKWYNPEKGFGFIGLGTGEKDVFVHATALQRSGLSVLTEGQRVIVEVAQGPKGLEARTVQVAA